MTVTKKFGRKILAMATMASIGTTFAVTPLYSSVAQADEIQKKPVSEKFYSETRSIASWQDYIKEATIVYGQHLDSKRKYKESVISSLGNPIFHYNSVTPNGSPQIQDSSSMFIGKTTLTNNSDNEQTLSTNSFTKTISHSITTSTTHGFKIGEKTSGKLSMPIGELGMEVSLEYNFSSTNSSTKSESYAYTATPQNIKVPAHSSVEVIVMLNKGKVRGNVNLLTRMSGSPSANHVYAPTSGESIGTAYIHLANYGQTVRYAKQFANLPYLSVNNDDSINLIGAGTYEAEVGTEFSVTVNPINNNRVSTGEGYSFKVKPEIQKVEK